MNYRVAVQEAKRLAKRSEQDQWRLAELTWEVVDAGKSQRQWAKDIGRSLGHTRRLFEIWSRWGDSAPNHRPSFSDCYEALFVGTDDPISATGSRRERALRQPPEKREDRVEMARKLLDDKEVAAEIVRDTDAMATLAYAEHERTVDKTGQRSTTRGLAEEMSVGRLLYKARKAILTALQLAKELDLTDDVKESLTFDSSEVRVALDWFDSLVKSGDTSWEDALAEWTEAQS